MLISDEYRELNAEMHRIREWGGGGYKHADMVRRLLKKYEATTVLDYGAGRATLSAVLQDVHVTNYDPCIPVFAADPAPADLLVCTDVLEHIEPECLVAVLQHMRDRCKIIAYMTIALRKGNKILPDGSLAHRIIEDGAWWFDTLRPFWSMTSMVHTPGRELELTARPRRD